MEIDGLLSTAVIELTLRLCFNLSTDFTVLPSTEVSLGLFGAHNLKEMKVRCINGSECIISAGS
jgi:hypothetical protein